MIELIITHSIAFFYLLTGSISDIKTREVADWSNYGLIAIGIASNLIFSLVSNNWNFILNSLMGFGVFLLLALIMFYTGQWGGGDSKMLMGLGALYGLGLRWEQSSFLVSFLLNTLIAGAVYGIIWSIVLAIKNRKKFLKEHIKITSNKNIKTTRKIFILLFAISIILFFAINDLLLRSMILSLTAMIFFTFYLWILIKAVEKSCMHKLVKPDKLTEGDWIVKDIKYKGKYIAGPKDLGIEKKQIAKLKKLYREKKIKNVLIKEGIPFVPSFFLGWLMTLAFGNILNWII
ncbi:MAG: prepilin peptidase [Nanoarchaeota archaeon]|nr:prepilin peptidase [Nanoarchaeota archaeon]